MLLPSDEKSPLLEDVLLSAHEMVIVHLLHYILDLHLVPPALLISLCFALLNVLVVVALCLFVSVGL